MPGIIPVTATDLHVRGSLGVSGSSLSLIRASLWDIRTLQHCLNLVWLVMQSNKNITKAWILYLMYRNTVHTPYFKSVYMIKQTFESFTIFFFYRSIFLNIDIIFKTSYTLHDTWHSTIVNFIHIQICAFINFRKCFC